VALEPYVRPPEEQLAGVATWFASTCRQCPAGCGIVVRIMNGRALKIEGNPEHPLNRGKLCARGQAGLQLLYNPDRLRGPVGQAQRGSRAFQSLEWNEAVNRLYTQLSDAGANSAIWLGSATSGHLHDLFQRLAAAVGAPAPLVYDLYGALSGYRELAGDDGALPVFDLGGSDVAVSFGANLLGPWLSAVRYGVEYGEFRSQPLGKRGYLVQMEPRMSITGAVADRWLPIRPGTEGQVAAAVLQIIASNGLGGEERASRASALAAQIDLGQVATTSELSLAQLEDLARIFAAAEHPLAIPGGHHEGQAMAAVRALNAVAGTAQMSPDPPLPALVRSRISPYSDVLDLVDRMRAGDVQMLLIHGANPAYDLPPGSGFSDALSNVPTVVSFAPLVDETAVQADLVLPDRTYLESWGYEVVSPATSRPIVGSQQPVVTPVFDARSTADVLLAVAQGIPAAAASMPWPDEVAFLKELITGLPPGAAGGSGTEVLWARFLQHGGWWPASAAGSPPPGPAPSQPIEVPALQYQGQEDQYPYFLHLYMSDMLSDGRGASQPWLQGSPDPMTTMAWQTWVEMHPATAQGLGIEDGDVVRLTSPYGTLEAPVYVYAAIRHDTVAVPTGQGHTDLGRYAQGRGDNPLALVGAETRSGGSLAWSNLRVRIEPTGQSVAMARFENRVGVTEGFINQGFPR
jgi:anaerobic selenocysteine-containing dehydrogenase